MRSSEPLPSLPRLEPPMREGARSARCTMTLWRQRQ
jgi:hypothetical protein